MFSKLSVAALALAVAAVAMSAPARALEFDNRRGSTFEADGNRDIGSFGPGGGNTGTGFGFGDRGPSGFELGERENFNKHDYGKSKVVELTDCTYYNFVRAPVAFKPIAVLFCTDECHVCKKLEGVWDILSKFFPKVVFAKVNTIEEQEVQKREDVDLVPGVILFTKRHPDGLRFVAPVCDESSLRSFITTYCDN
jgi:thiol-disulfide isomerase/thioredoxin